MTRQKSNRSVGSAVVAAVALLSLVPQGTLAERLTLEDAMALGRERAREVTAAKARHVAQEARLDESKAYRLPSVRLSEIWMQTDAPAEVFGLELNQERFSFQDFVASDPNRPNALSSSTTRLEINLPLYTGGELASRIRQAELAAAAAGDRFRRTTDEAALAAAESFIQLAQARERVALLARALNTVNAHVELARSYVEQGMLVTSELLRAQVEHSRVADLLAAAKGQAKVAEANLSFRLSFDLGTEWELTRLPALQTLDLKLDDWLLGAADRADLAAALQMKGIAALEVDIRRAAQRPQIGLQARYDLIDERLFGSHGDNSAVMAMASIDIFSGGRHRAAKAAARAEAEAVASDVDRFAESIRLEIRQAYEEATSARDRLSSARGAVVAATETERIVEERFHQGIVKTIDLLDAATSRREAETRELVARSDAHLATLRLAVAAGRSPESTIQSQPKPNQEAATEPIAGGENLEPKNRAVLPPTGSATAMER